MPSSLSVLARISLVEESTWFVAHTVSTKIVTRSLNTQSLRVRTVDDAIR